MATTWVFQNGERRMYAQRQERDDQLELTVWGTDVEHQLYAFDDSLSFVAFMTDFERDAANGGWSLIDFIPERRQGGDRQAVPRRNERRRRPQDGPGTLIRFPPKSRD